MNCRYVEAIEKAIEKALAIARISDFENENARPLRRLVTSLIVLKATLRS